MFFRADRDIIGERADLQHKIGERGHRLRELKEQKNELDQQKMVVESHRQNLIDNIQVILNL